MYRYMKVGLVHFMAFPATMKGSGPILETIRTLATDNYFNAIEITTIADKEERKQVKQILETSHMTVAYGAQPRLLTAGLNVNDLNEGMRKEALDILMDGVNEAYEIGASGISFLSGKYEEATKEMAFNKLLDSTKTICRYAKEKGDLRVVLEIFDYDVDKKSLIGPAPLALRYVEEVRKEYDNFGLMVDLSHIPLLHETIEQSILPIKDYIMHAHIGNCVMRDPAFEGYGDQHPRFGFPNSEIDVDEVTHYLRVLLDIGFLNTERPPIVSFEIKPYGDEHPDLVIANAKRTLTEAWARL